jgi:predicted Zn-dependent protease
VSALEVAERALAAARGDEAEAVVTAERFGFARFAGSEVHQPTLVDNLVVTLRVARDGKVGTAETNRISDEGLAELARRAAEAADSSVPKPTWPGFAAGSSYPDAAGGFDLDTAALGPEDQARLASAAIEASGELPAYGYFTSGETEIAVATTQGASATQRLTDATTLVLAADERSSGYAEATAWRAADIDPAAVAREACEKALRTRGAEAVEPGRFAAVLEPWAVADLLAYFSYDSLGGLGLLEERSYLTGRIGELVVDERVTLVDDALEPRGLPKAFDFEGVPKARVPLIENGVARGVVWDRERAARAGNGQESTGHGPPPLVRDYGPLPYALSLAGGEAESYAELAELVGDGIHITRLHYLGIVDPREGIITGMTRDGTFRIRDGKVAEPLVNLRFTVSLPDVLRELHGLTRDVVLVNGSDFYGERFPCGSLVPGIATASFTITGVGSKPGI